MRHRYQTREWVEEKRSDANGVNISHFWVSAPAPESKKMGLLQGWEFYEGN